MTSGPLPKLFIMSNGLAVREWQRKERERERERERETGERGMEQKRRRRRRNSDKDFICQGGERVKSDWVCAVCETKGPMQKMEARSKATKFEAELIYSFSF